ncbi:hypothetical protein D3C86_1685540 [compost metagenome]
MNVAINEAGMVTITITAFRKLCRKKSITNATSTTASIKSWITASADSSVKIELSLTILMSSLLAAYSTFSFSIMACTPLLTSTAFASLCLII